jgi:hypothetical protein
MEQIQLSQGQFALVDDQDFPQLSEFRWCYRAERDGRQGYAVRHVKVGGKDRLSYLHREVLPAPEGHETIFLNHDRLDCRRQNLKVVTKHEARRHHRVRSDSRSGVKGVRFNPDGGTWTAITYRHGHCYHVGTYFTQEQAQAAYERDLRRENPDLHTAPDRVDRPGSPGPVQPNNPGGPCLSERR